MIHVKKLKLGEVDYEFSLPFRKIIAIDEYLQSQELGVNNVYELMSAVHSLSNEVWLRCWFKSIKSPGDVEWENFLSDIDSSGLKPLEVLGEFTSTFTSCLSVVKPGKAKAANTSTNPKVSIAKNA